MTSRLHTPIAWTFHFSLLSPAFVGGAEPNETAQLRLPSLKGALRDWYRMLVGADAAAGTLKEWPGWLTESHLFGGVAPGEGQGRMILSFTEPTRHFTHRDGVDVRDFKRHRLGLNYLGYTLGMRPNNRVAVPAGQSLGVRAFFPRGLRDDQEKLIIATWWLFAHFGGIGTRSRRGFGALTLERWPKNGRMMMANPARSVPALPNPTTTSGGREIMQEIATGLWAITAWVKELRIQHGVEKKSDSRSPQRKQTLPSYQLIEGDTLPAIWTGKKGRGWQTWEDALDAIGVEMMRFRSGESRDRRRGGPNVDGFTFSTLGALERNKSLPHAPFRTAFGLPLTYFNKRTKARRVLLPVISSEDQARRLPSPLILRPYRASNGQLFVLLLRLGGQLPGRDVDVREQRQHGYTRAFGDKGTLILDAFIKGLPGRPVEVEL